LKRFLLWILVVILAVIVLSIPYILGYISATDEMKYEYTLDCYNENGKKKEIKFKTSRELKEDAYLMLEVRTFGVHTWKEVQTNELPEKVKTALNVE